MNSKNNISPDQKQELLDVLQRRFKQNMQRHKSLQWPDIVARLTTHSSKMWSLNEMEKTGGEPDVTGYDQITGEYIFCDCSAESPKGRRSLCYDRQALKARKEHKPVNSALDMAADMGIEILTEEQYHSLQQLGKFDAKTSSWLKTPENIRKRGGAIFGDYRYDHVFIYHNGAESYYAARGFRGILRM